MNSLIDTKKVFFEGFNDALKSRYPFRKLYNEGYGLEFRAYYCGWNMGLAAIRARENKNAS
jgi:hypothetical protein